MKLKIDYYIVPVTLVIGAIVTIILAILHLGWNYYLIGLFTSLLTHGMIIKQNYKLSKFAAEDPEKKLYNPKKVVYSGYLIRSLVFIAVFAVIIYTCRIWETKDNIWLVVTALAGFLTLKIALIGGYLIFRKKVDEA